MGETGLYTGWIGSIGWFLYTYYYAVCTNTSLVDGSTLITFPSVKQGLLRTLDAETYLCRNLCVRHIVKARGQFGRQFVGTDWARRSLIIIVWRSDGGLPCWKTKAIMLEWWILWCWQILSFKSFMSTRMNAPTRMRHYMLYIIWGARCIWCEVSGDYGLLLLVLCDCYHWPGDNQGDW